MKTTNSNPLERLVITKAELGLKNSILTDIKNMDSSLSENDESFKIAFVLLLAANYGLKDLPRIKRVSGYDTLFLAKTVTDMRNTGLWKNGKLVHSGWLDKKSGGMAFWLDVAVVRGWLERKSFDQHKCKFCKHEWVRRGKNSPKVCPKCKRQNFEDVPVKEA